jgi:hypothetical protein
MLATNKNLGFCCDKKGRGTKPVSEKEISSWVAIFMIKGD